MDTIINENTSETIELKTGMNGLAQMVEMMAQSTQAYQDLDKKYQDANKRISELETQLQEAKKESEKKDEIINSLEGETMKYRDLSNQRLGIIQCLMLSITAVKAFLSKVTDVSMYFFIRSFLLETLFNNQDLETIQAVNEMTRLPDPVKPQTNITAEKVEMKNDNVEKQEMNFKNSVGQVIGHADEINTHKEDK